MPQPEDPDPVSDEPWTIDRLVAGGDGFLRAPDGRAAFVPGAFPGDSIRPAAIASKKRHLRVLRFELVEPSPDRVERPCAVAGCGGCAWMGLNRPAQLRAKGAVLLECLRRLGGFVGLESVPMHEAGPDLGYRSRVRLHRAGGQLGFHASGSRRIVPVDRCAVACEPINEVLAGLDRGGAPAEVELRASPDGVQVLVDGRLCAGPASQRIDVPGAWLEVPAGAFSQVNPHVNRALVAAVVEGARTRGVRAVADLHCGAGNFALALAAAGLSVRGCDVAAAGVQAAQRSAVSQDLDAAFAVSSAAAFAVSSAAAGHRAELVLLDPPRTGDREAAEALAADPPQHLAYVSCDPATLARDLRTLVDGGMVLDDVQGWDMFPHTPHVEALAWLRRAP